MRDDSPTRRPLTARGRGAVERGAAEVSPPKSFVGAPGRDRHAAQATNTTPRTVTRHTHTTWGTWNPWTPNRVSSAPRPSTPAIPKTSGGPYRGDEESHDPAPPDPEPECCQQHQGPQRIESGDTEGESRSEERQHRERLLGSHFSNGMNCPRVAQQRSSLNFTSMPSSCYHLWVGFAR